VSRKAENTLIVVVFGLALLVRLVFLAVVPVKPIAGGDPRAYEQTALNILREGAIYSEEGHAFRPPLYPFFVAFVYLILGSDHQNIFLFQALLSAISAVLLFQMLRSLGLLTALLGGGLFVVHPLILFYTKQVLTESLYIFLLSLLIYLALQVRERGLKSAICLGLVMGLATLCRSDSVLLSALLLIALFVFQRGQFSRKLTTVFVVFIAYLLTLSPWLTRNMITVGAPVLSTNGGITFYQGNSPEATGGYINLEFSREVPNGELARNDYFFQEGFEYIRANSKTYPLLLRKKLVALWSPNGNFILDLSDILLIPFSIIGLVLALWDRLKWHLYAFMASPIVSVTITALIFHGERRYRTPMYVSLIFFASIPLAIVTQRLIQGLAKRHWILV